MTKFLVNKKLQFDQVHLGTNFDFIKFLAMLMTFLGSKNAHFLNFFSNADHF